jgi:predicted enzyme related to lactoylglutathione lyase
MIGTAESYPMIPAQHLARAVAFYTEVLEHTIVDANTPGIAFLANARGGKLFLFQRAPATSDHSLAAFAVTDIEAVVDELVARGVNFERFDMGPTMVADARGILTAGDARTAWFRDSEGNLLSLHSRATPQLA